MRNTKLPLWLLSSNPLIGAEDDESDSNESGSGNLGEGGDSSGEGSNGDDSDDPDDSDDSDDSDDDPDDDKGSGASSGLRRDLSSTRAQLREAQKQIKAFQKDKEKADNAKKSDTERLQGELDKSTERVTKLSEAFRKSTIDRVVSRLAAKQNFRDAEDAMAFINFSAVDIDQDEDDPSKVEVSEDNVKAELKRIARAKPHLIKSGTDDGEPTGSGFGRRKNKGDNDEEKKLAEKYSSL